MQEIKAAVLPVFEKYSEKIAAAYPFGSIARDAGYQLSDIDFAILHYRKAKDSYFNTRISLYTDLCRALKRNDVGIVLLNRANNLFLVD